jgi:hypothetical protein
MPGNCIRTAKGATGHDGVTTIWLEKIRIESSQARIGIQSVHYSLIRAWTRESNAGVRLTNG